MIAKLFRLCRYLSFLGGAALVLIGGAGAALGLGYVLLHGELTIVETTVTYVAFPIVLCTGIGLLVAGVVLLCLEKRSVEDLANAWHTLLARASDLGFLGLLLAVGAVGVVGFGAAVFGWRALEFSDSDQLCTELCHQAMEPESAPHRDSAHANISCTKCHIAPGIMPWVKAKVNGLAQVYGVLTNRFERPIHAAPHAIPHPKETCENCHWDSSFWGDKLDNRLRYGYDMENSRRYIRINTHVGGGSPSHGMVGGIHQHMFEYGITYKAADKRHQEIAQFTVAKKDGTTTTYNLFEKGEQKHTQAELDDFENVDMSCLDCHNRPAHKLLTPDESIDRALEAGRIDRTLPSIKTVSVAAVNGDYATEEEALTGIADYVKTYYTEHFQGKILERGDALDRAVEALQDIYKRNAFPEMHVTPVTYPDNTGHRVSPGCFRCHGGHHVAKESGKPFKSTCESCHTFYEEARDGGSLTVTTADGSWFHPFRHKERFNQEVNCWDCHAAASPYSQCKSCHEKDRSLGKMAFECSMCHRPGAEKVSQTSCQACHPTGKSAMHQNKGHQDCLACHKNHLWKADVQHASCGVTGCHKAEELEAWKTEGPGHEKCRVNDFKGVDELMNGLPSGPAPGLAKRQSAADADAGKGTVVETGTQNQESAAPSGGGTP